MNLKLSLSNTFGFLLFLLLISKLKNMCFTNLLISNQLEILFEISHVSSIVQILFCPLVKTLSFLLSILFCQLLL